MQEEFISTLTHEIRTPLTSIKGFSKTLLNSWDMIDDNKKKEFLEIILNQSQRLINLTENVLNVAKLDSNVDKLINTKVDINLSIENAINTLKGNYPDFKFDFKKAKASLFCYCDYDKTQQVLINILDNAIKYSVDSNKIEIKTGLKDNFNFISIKNFGSCIKKEDKEKIFEKFYRVDSYLKSKAQGSGLGLYIVKSLINKMDGLIEVNSDETRSSVEFIIYLPAWEIEKEFKSFV